MPRSSSNPATRASTTPAAARMCPNGPMTLKILAKGGTPLRTCWPPYANIDVSRSRSSWNPLMEYVRGGGDHYRRDQDVEGSPTSRCHPMGLVDDCGVMMSAGPRLSGHRFIDRECA